MAFNKARVLQEAESLASQGKISQAIDRYLRILEKDPSELILLNTIGDLYVRDKNISEGLKHFYKLAEAYVQNGYILKAIAIYKKIVKLEPDSVGPLLKLGELYQAQRQVRETRELYYQVAEFYKKRKQNDKALETLRKVVQLDAENATARARLAAFCEEMGRKDEAAQVYLETAQLALRREDTGAVEIALKKAEELSPQEPQLQLLKARLALALKRPEEAEAILSGTPGLMDDPAARAALIDSFVALRQLKKAEALALEFCRATPPDISLLACFVSACVQAGQFDVASKTLSVVANELIAQGNTSALMESLRLIRSKSPQHLPALELIFRICDESGDADALREILEALGHAYLQCGQFEKAQQSFQRLIDHDPGNEHYDVLLKDVRQKQIEKFGYAPDVEMSPPPIEPDQEEVPLPPASSQPVTDREGMVKEALENSELFARYHLLSRAVAELERVLEIYPDETEIHKHLVGMCWKDLPERAEKAAQALAVIYAQQGDAEGARRFAQMAGEPEAAAALAVRIPAIQAQAPGPEPSLPTSVQPAATVAEEVGPDSEGSPAPVQESQPASFNLPLAPEAATPEPLESPLDAAMPGLSTLSPASYSEAQTIDLSEDLDSFLTMKGKTAAAPESPQQGASFNYDDSRIEISFYLEHGFFEEARAAVEVLERTLPSDPRIAELRRLVDAYTAGGTSEASPKLAVDAQERAPVEAAARPGEETVDQHKLVSSSEAPIPEAPLAAVPPVSPREEEPPLEAAPGASVESSVNLPGDFIEEFESATERQEPHSSLPAPPSSATEEPGSEDDAETHYNLGVAFWEMRLLDQAIGEFQKVVNSAEKKATPANYLQACSLLAACFMDKGMATIAVKWYCRALETPHLDEEARLALHYDLGVAYEQAGDLPRALEMFSEVYSQKIDFRDVAEKIRASQQKGS